MAICMKALGELRRVGHAIKDFLPKKVDLGVFHPVCLI
jgi:hypothetical protein